MTDDRKPRSWLRSVSALDELAARREVYEVRKPGAIEPPDPDSLDRPAITRRLSPASMRLLGTAVGDLAERLGGSLTAAPSFDPAYIGDGKASIALVLTVSVEALNEYAAEPPPRDPTTAPEAIADATDGSPVGWRK